MTKKVYNSPEIIVAKVQLTAMMQTGSGNTEGVGYGGQIGNTGQPSKANSLGYISYDED